VISGVRRCEVCRLLDDGRRREPVNPLHQLLNMDGNGYSCSGHNRLIVIYVL
jgi:hypothetical protein